MVNTEYRYAFIYKMLSHLMNILLVCKHQILLRKKILAYSWMIRTQVFFLIYVRFNYIGFKVFNLTADITAMRRFHSFFWVVMVLVTLYRTMSPFMEPDKEAYLKSL